MNNIATLNDRPAPYRRGLTGDDLLYEVRLLISKLQIGDVLRIDPRFFYEMRRVMSMNDIPFAWTFWRDWETEEACIRRDA